VTPEQSDAFATVSVTVTVAVDVAVRYWKFQYGPRLATPSGSDTDVSVTSANEPSDVWSVARTCEQ
jgi:hypothetical protein